jgi:trimethylamine:corrinoid methyltransferase-like protein
MAGGSVWLDAGLLSIDEVFSPIQMVLDNELLSALKHFTQTFEISGESIGLDTIFEAGPGGSYLDKIHTARHFRTEHWQPKIWSRQMLNPWLSGSRLLDTDLARQIALDIQNSGKEYCGLSDEMDRDILKIIHSARKVFEK